MHPQKSPCNRDWGFPASSGCGSWDLEPGSLGGSTCQKLQILLNFSERCELPSLPADLGRIRPKEPPSARPGHPIPSGVFLAVPPSPLTHCCRPRGGASPRHHGAFPPATPLEVLSPPGPHSFSDWCLSQGLPCPWPRRCRAGPLQGPLGHLKESGNPCDLAYQADAGTCTPGGQIDSPVPLAAQLSVPQAPSPEGLGWGWGRTSSPPSCA